MFSSIVSASAPAGLQPVSFDVLFSDVCCPGRWLEVVLFVSDCLGCGWMVCVLCSGIISFALHGLLTNRSGSGLFRSSFCASTVCINV